MVDFDAVHAAVHYPPDRRSRVWIRPSLVALGSLLVVIPVAIAWIEMSVRGLPTIAPIASVNPKNVASPHGFPVWVRYCHFFNFLFVTLVIRSGLSILADHPRLYFNNDCTPGSEWIKFTPITVPEGRLWTAKDDARYISPLLGTPGYRHTDTDQVLRPREPDGFSRPMLVRLSGLMGPWPADRRKGVRGDRTSRSNMGAYITGRSSCQGTIRLRRDDGSCRVSGRGPGWPFSRGAVCSRRR